MKTSNGHLVRRWYGYYLAEIRYNPKVGLFVAVLWRNGEVRHIVRGVTFPECQDRCLDWAYAHRR